MDKNNMNTFLSIGLIGLGSIILVNVVAILAFNKPEAAFLTDDWWSTWFANYVVWFVFTIIGLGQRLSSKNKDNNSSSR